MNRIKELRISLGLTQFNLGKKIGLNQTAIGKYERGQLEPSLDTLKKLALLFECSIDYIIGFTDDFGNVTIYKETEQLTALSHDEQKIIDVLRKNTPMNAIEWINMYATLPGYMQENIFAELKGMYLGYSVSKSKKLKENFNK